jgi:hypothetical protein
MIDNIRNRHSGETVAEWIPMYVAELPIDAVSLSGVISDGNDGFSLRGADLDEFIIQSIRILLGHGALTVIGGGDSPYDWIHQPQYGTKADDVIKNVIAEWKASGVDPDLGGLWFARPDPAFPRFVKAG